MDPDMNGNIGGFGEELKGGADLFTWSRFFPKAKIIIGVDISKKSFHVAPNVKMFQASQVDEKAVNEICEKYGPFDLIVDDGSHMVDHVIATFKLVWKCLKYDGLYVLEDAQSSYSEGAKGSKDLDANWTSMNFFKRLIDDQNFAEIAAYGNSYVPSIYAKELAGMHFYHNMVFIEKGDNNYPSSMVIAGQMTVPKHWLS
ncbi:hypothetical protein Tcan_14073 [Toxocara canis]|uniref:Uncharacterized protein n=1 Tax=Toxocara canis TaxID=6265 RepID=A0A0B2VCF9_TOXCA|nr:hypothetical protein Tcan_14073 [Toxocara canis]